MSNSSSLIDKSSPIPAYHQITTDLTERVDNGEWKLGDRLPSETLLAEQYGVSRLTLRQALADLENRGIIKRVQGKGAYLTGMTKPFVEDLNFPILNQKKKDKIPDRSANKVLELRREDAPPLAVQKLFFTEKEIPLIYLRRLFVREGKPLGLNHAWFPEAMVPGILELGLVESSISTTLKERYNCKFDKIDNYIEAANAGAEEAALLECPYSASILKILSTYFLKNGVLIEHSCTLWLGSLTRFHLLVKDSDSGDID